MIADSAFLLVPGVPPEAAKAVNHRIAEVLTAQLPSPHLLDPEDEYDSLLLVAPKMYTATYGGGKKRKDRGLALVRRDNTPAIVNAQKALVARIHSDALSPDDAVSIAKELRTRFVSSIATAHEDAVQISHFVQSSSLSKPLVGKGAYAASAESAVLTVARGWLAADPTASVGLGTRVPFVIRAGQGVKPN